jgi:IS1 family transposase
LKNKEINGFCSDYWKSYSELIPSENIANQKLKPLQLKVTTVEFGIIWQDLNGKENVIQNHKK